MKELENSKEYYDNIEIPEELASIVDRAVKESEVKRKIKQQSSRTKGKVISMNRKTHKKNTVRKVIISIGSVAAALVLMMAVGVNTNQAFAQEMSKIPVIGAVVKVLTVTSYQKQNDNVNVSVNVPGIEESSNAFVADVNAEINKIVDDYVADAEKRIAEYKAAFLGTNGTEKEWNERGIQVNVNYDIKYQDASKVSFVLDAYENWVSFSEVRTYYNLDLVNNKRLTLKDMLGDDYVNVANSQILKQMDERIKTNGYVYWGFGDATETMGDEGFKTVDENTHFYINEKGNVVITFEKYSIGPGYMGVQEFEITK